MARETNEFYDKSKTRGTQVSGTKRSQSFRAITDMHSIMVHALMTGPLSVSGVLRFFLIKHMLDNNKHY